MAWRLIHFFFLLLVYPAVGIANDDLSHFPELRGAGVLFVDAQGNEAISSQAGESFIPASTTKLVTAWLALNHWGESHRFQTHFYFDPTSKMLWIKASGDPFLVSEEILLIATALANLGITDLAGIGLDTTAFQSALQVPGGGRSDNPYDAIPAALAANFNTIAVNKIKGRVISAEAQTPITPFSSVHGQTASNSARINTGSNTRDAERYFAELLTAFLRQQGVLVRNQVRWGTAPQQTPLYSHSNSKTLGEMVRPMMQYSTNFIANQLVLMLSAEHTQRPANFADVQAYMETTLATQLGWQHFTLKEGAGLSRDNRLSPQQLVTLLEAFRSWQHLLPEVTDGIVAKSGTLNKVSTLAGYVVKQQQWQPFALMMGQSVAHHRRNKIARELARH